MRSEFERKRSWPEVDTFPIFAYREWGKPRGTWQAITCVPTEIRTDHLLNTNLDYYRYTSLLGSAL
jgi:hypothetical protein